LSAYFIAWPCYRLYYVSAMMTLYMSIMSPSEGIQEPPLRNE